MGRNNVFDRITPDEALEILRRLFKEDQNIEQTILKIADNVIREVDVDEICEDVFFALDGIDVDDLWNRSGASSDGYTSTVDMAYEMLEEELDFFSSEVVRLCELNMEKEAMLYCMGVLKGIYQYDHESESEFKDWSTDMPGECFADILRGWKKQSTSKKIEEMNSFLMKECSQWI